MRKTNLVRFGFVLCISLAIFSINGCFGGRRPPQDKVKHTRRPLIGPPPSAVADAPSAPARKAAVAVDEDFSFGGAKASAGFDDAAGRSALAPPPELARAAASVSQSEPPVTIPQATVGRISHETLEPFTLDTPKVTAIAAPPVPSGFAATQTSSVFSTPRPAALTARAVAYEPISASGAKRTIHTVQRGENLSSIARIYGLSWTKLLAANPSLANPNQIRVDDTLVIPVTK